MTKSNFITIDSYWEHIEWRNLFLSPKAMSDIVTIMPQPIFPKKKKKEKMGEGQIFRPTCDPHLPTYSPPYNHRYLSASLLASHTPLFLLFSFLFIQAQKHSSPHSPTGASPHLHNYFFGEFYLKNSMRTS